MAEIKCYICWWDMYPKYTGKDWWYKTSDKEYIISRCDYCWLEKIDPTPSKKEQSSFYQKKYYSYTLKENTEKFGIKKNIMYRLFDYLMRLIGNTVFTLDYFKGQDNQSKLFLDIGCWDWITLKQMKLRGWTVSWFEFALDSEIKNDIYYWPSLIDIDFWDKKFDVIYIKHVFEHLDNPIGYLRKIHQISHLKTKIMFILPNVNCFSSKALWQYAPERDIPRHLYNYNNRNIMHLLSNQWFDICKFGYLKNYWFSVWLQRYLNDKLNISFRWVVRLFLVIPAILDMLLDFTQSSNQMGILVKKIKCL